MSDSRTPVDANLAPVIAGAARKHYGAKRVRRSIKHYLFGRGIAAVASFFVALLLVRELSVADYAGYTALSGLLIGLMIFSNGGFERVIPRYFPELRVMGAEGQLRRFCWFLMGVRFLLLLLVLTPLLFAFHWLSTRLSIPGDSALMWAFLCYAAMFGMQQHTDNCLQALLEQRAATQGNAIDWFSKLFALLFCYFYFGQLSLVLCVWIFACTAGLSWLYMFWRLYQHLKAQPDPGLKALNPKQVARMAGYSYLLPIAGFHAAPSAGKLLAAYLLPTAAVAMVGFAQSFTQFLKRNLPARLMLGVIEPAIMARYAETKDFSQTVRLVGIVLKLNLFILVPIAAWISLNGKPIIELFTGGKYGDSAWLIGCYMLILIMESHRLILHLITNAVEQSQLLLQSNLASMIFLPLTIIAANQFGLIGLVACLLAISFSRNFYVVFALRRRSFFYAPDWMGIMRIAVTGGAAAVAGNLVPRLFGTGVAIAVASAIFSGLLYLGLSLLFKPFTQLERDTVNNFLGKKFFFL
ncbi:MAG TPA: hypothetical protein VJU83_12665 [Burkholderiales bacterium]|nr:hypothetical protein [Burkholderiales bacterium]